jgi:hypothetical protein
MSSSIPDLKLTSEDSCFEKHTFKEHINLPYLEKLIVSDFLNEESWVVGGKLIENEKTQLLKMKNKVFKDGTLKVKYAKTSMKYGRVYAQNANSLGSLRREIRHTLCKGLYTDIDMVNCHVKLLLEICKGNQLEHTMLNQYCENRDAVREEIMVRHGVSKDAAKRLFLTLQYGGGVKSWREKEIEEWVLTKYKDDERLKVKNKRKAAKLMIKKVDEQDAEFQDWYNGLLIHHEPTDFVNAFKKELKGIGKIIAGQNEKVCAKIEKKLKEADAKDLQDTYNVQGSFMSFFCQEHERRMLEIAYKLLEKELAITHFDAVLCYDGIMVKTADYDESLIQKLEDEIMEKYGIEMKFSAKSMDEGYDLSNIDTPETRTEEIARLNAVSYDSIKVEFEKVNFKVLRPLSYATLYHGEVILRNRTDFTNTYENLQYNKIVENARGDYLKEVSFVSDWLKDASCRTYERLDFFPKCEVPEGVYNAFDGLAGDSLKESEEEIDVTQTLMWKHLQNLCGKEKQVMPYVLNWLANRIQEPSVKPNTALIFQSEPGAGKDTFWEWFGEYMVGDKYYVNEDKEELIFGRFNAAIENKLVIVLNETSSASTVKMINGIKNAMTRKKNKIEFKGVTAYDSSNHAAYVFLSNMLDAFKVEEGDRRMVAIQCLNNMIGDKNYFVNLRAEMEKEKYNKAWYDYFMNLDLSEVNFTLDRPTTEYYKTLKEQSTPIVARFLCQKYARMSISEGVNDRQYAKEMYDEFSGYYYEQGFKADTVPSAIKFGLLMTAYEGFSKKSGKKGMVYMIDVTTMMDYMIKKEYHSPEE